MSTSEASIAAHRGGLARWCAWLGARGKRLAKQTVLLVIAVLLTIVTLRAIDSQRGPPLERWHTFVPTEPSIDELDRMDWTDYLAAEDAVMRSVQVMVTAKLPESQRVPTNRYALESPMNPEGFDRNWNRSYVLEPTGEPIGAVVLLHGLTDAPYSLRSIAAHYADAGFVAVGIRLPGHGTVPGGLTNIAWEDWLAATRVAVREARARTSPDAPLHIVGYSLGAALAVQYTLDALDEEHARPKGAPPDTPRLARPDRIVLLSPMIGVTRFARFSGIAGWPALLPRFAKAAWLDNLPEFNPFKYNSFPVNAATQTHRLSTALQAAVAQRAVDGRLDRMPPILAFQSILDATVSTAAVFSGLFAHLPENGSELVLFDVHRSGRFGPLLRPRAFQAIETVIPHLPQLARIVAIESDPDEPNGARERSYAARSVEPAFRGLSVSFPPELFSLSHVALPFPIDDPLYGLSPREDESFGITLGTIVGRGERGALIMSLDSLQRATSNPFFPYVLERIDAGIRDPKPVSTAGGSTVRAGAQNAAVPAQLEAEPPERSDHQGSHSP